RLLKPHIIAGSNESPAIIGRNARLEGLARAGATVTVFEGPDQFCIGELPSCNVAEIASVVAGTDRRWNVQPDLEEARNYNLYLQAELDGDVSAPPLGIHLPYVVRIDSMLDAAGFDLDHFTLQTQSQTAQPNALGGSSGLTPDEPWTLNIRQD